MPGTGDHKQTVREAFTNQAEAYAANPSITDPERIDRLVRTSGATASDRVLEVATGPGHVALGFAEVCESVVGIDLTGAPLSIAAERKRDREVDGVEFLQGDAETLPFPEDSFDVTVCRLALHHVEDPGGVLREMVRVCRPGGTVAVEDLVVSEHSRRGEYQNEMERLRDPAHVRALPLSELVSTVAERGIEVEDVRTGTIVQNVETWLDNAETPEPRASEVREMMREDEDRDLSGIRPHRRDGDLHFVQRTALVVGRVLEQYLNGPESDFE
jgi:ubiquinone/menaquinone biosynthesis C-methylase UbiE